MGAAENGLMMIVELLLEKPPPHGADVTAVGIVRMDKTKALPS